MRVLDIHPGRWLSLSALVVLVLAGCGDKDSDSGALVGGTDGGSVDGGSVDGGGTDGGNVDGGGGDGGSTDGGGADPELPVVESLDAWCYPHTTGTDDFIWQVDAAVSDPQGDESLAPYFDGITVLQSGSNVAGYAMSCGGTGSCSGSFNESQDGIRCDIADTYTIQVRVLDEDDNWSAPVEVTGRSCPSADPC